MTSTYKVLNSSDVENVDKVKQDFSLDVLLSLSKKPKELPSRYLYDEIGSRLFKDIMDLPEYYLTDCEFEVIEKHREEISKFVSDEPFNLIELGAGSGKKTELLLKQFLKQSLNFHYVPIDISESAMKDLTLLLNKQFKGLHTSGIVSEYFDGIKWLKNNADRRNLVLFMGSNIGNFHTADSYTFLRCIWDSLNDNDLLLIGFDLKKDTDLMLKAYNDSKGVTSKFNLNLLNRINKELGGNFDLSKFKFFSNYDVHTGAIESYLLSLEKQEVFISALGQSFSFNEWEPIHTEYSYKYLESDIEALALETGFTIEKQFYDKNHYFVDSLWRVKKLSS